MNPSLLTSILLAVTIWPTCVTAQSKRDVDVRALGVLQSSVAAMGGLGAPSLHDSQVSGTLTGLQTKDAPRTGIVIKTQGSSLRWEYPGSAIGALVISNGRASRMSDGRWHREPGSNARNKRADHFPLLLILQELGRIDVDLEYLGIEAVSSRPTHRIRLQRFSSLGTPLDDKLTKDSRIDVFVDTESLLVVKCSLSLLSSTDWRRSLPLEIFYEDYRAVSGVQIPFKQRTILAGKPLAELQISSVALNLGLNPADFQGR